MTMGKNCHGYSFYLRKFALEMNPINLEFLKQIVPFKIFSEEWDLRRREILIMDFVKCCSVK